MSLPRHATAEYEPQPIVVEVAEAMTDPTDFLVMRQFESSVVGQFESSELTHHQLARKG